MKWLISLIVMLVACKQPPMDGQCVEDTTEYHTGSTKTAYWCKWHGYMWFCTEGGLHCYRRDKLPAEL